MGTDLPAAAEARLVIAATGVVPPLVRCGRMGKLFQKSIVDPDFEYGQILGDAAVAALVTSCARARQAPQASEMSGIDRLASSDCAAANALAKSV